MALTGWHTAESGEGSEYWRNGQCIAETENDGGEWFANIYVQEDNRCNGPFLTDEDAQQFIEKAVKA